MKRRSTITMMTNLLLDLGNPTMKSIEISVHRESGMRRGCSVPEVLIVSPLLYR
jgi:hypothetical protein